MDILKSLTQENTPEPIDLSTLAQPPVVENAVPLATTRNRAAQAALLANKGTDPISMYNDAMAQAQAGNTKATEAPMKEFFTQEGERDMQAVMSVLSSPDYSLAQKKSAVEAMNKNPILKDSSISLMTKGLQTESPGETDEAEKTRGFVAEGFNQHYEAIATVQGLVNGHGASLSSKALGEKGTPFYQSPFAGLVESALAPWFTGMSSLKMRKALMESEGKKMTLWQGIKALTFEAGTVTLDAREKLESIPPAGQEAYLNNLIKIIQNNSGAYLSNDNQYDQFQKIVALTQEGGYGKGSAFLDNAMWLLDLVGVGQVIRGSKVVGKLSKTVKPAVTAARAEKAVETAKAAKPSRMPISPSGFTPAKAPVPMKGANDAKIVKMQEEVSTLLGDAGNTLDKGAVANLKQERAAIPKPDSSPEAIKTLTKQLQQGQGVSYKEATAQAKKQVADQVAEYDARVGRIDSQLATNATASTVSQRIDTLEKEIAKLSAKNEQVPMQVNPIVDAIRRIDANSAIRIENPASVASILHNSNPHQIRSFHKAMVVGDAEEGAQALYGVNRTQAVVNDVYPQVITESGKVLAKAPDVQRVLRMDPEIVKGLKGLIQSSDVAIHYSRNEMKSARSNIVRDFSSATDLVPNDSMGGFEKGFTTKGSHVEISAVYGTAEGAFIRAEEAVDQAKFALRNQGILDSDIEILARKGGDYEPVPLSEVAGKDGNYLVRINVRREVDPTDLLDEKSVARWDKENSNVRLNFMDRAAVAVWNRTGSVSRLLLDAASMLPARLTGGAVVAADVTAGFEKHMLELATQFSDKYAKFKSPRKAKIDEYIKRANFQEIAFDEAKLIGEGFIEPEIATLRSWRDFWDAHYYLENYDVIRTYNHQGYQLLKDATQELHAKPIVKNTQIGKIYDPSTQNVRAITTDEIDQLYDGGGTLAKLRRPSEFTFDVPTPAGSKPLTETAEYIVVRNTPTEYLRKFRETDTVLNYKEGYYQIHYKAPRFVDEISFAADGVTEIGRKAIAVAGDTEEATHFKTRMERNNPDKKYLVRSDSKAMSVGNNDWVDLNSSRGRIAQRQRGKLLEDATGINHLGDGSYIVNPVDSAVRAAKSISGRTVNRPMLETAKARALDEFADVFPPNGMGGKRFPTSVEEIGAEGLHDTSHVADARTTFENINYLENGYINSIDDFLKSSINAVSTALGEAGLSKAERAAVALGDIAPLNTAKRITSYALIGSNILRNWVVQPSQALRTVAYSPTAWLSGDVGKYIANYLTHSLGRTHLLSKEGKEFVNFLDTSGLFQAIDKHNLVRGSLADMAGNHNAVTRVINKALHIPPKVGFAMGEAANMQLHAAAVFSRWKRAGRDMSDITTLREAHSELRAISYDMNIAGDMPYNQNWASVALQFMQMPHKAFLFATNRRIPFRQKAQMIAFDFVLYGTPIALISELVGGDIFPENEVINEVAQDGLVSLIFNATASTLLAEDTAVDFSSLNPNGWEGIAKLHAGLREGGYSEIINNSPAGQLFLGEGGKFNNAMLHMSRFFNPWREEERTTEEAITTLGEITKILSGASNAAKARQALALGKIFDKQGVVIDPHVSNTEAVMQAFGFGTKTVKQVYATQRSVMEGTKAYEDEVKSTIREAMRYHQSAMGLGIRDHSQQQKVVGELLMVHKDDPVAMKIIQQEVYRGITGKDNQMMPMMLNSAGYPEYGLTVDQIKNSPLSDDEKHKLIKNLELAKNASDKYKESK